MKTKDINNKHNSLFDKESFSLKTNDIPGTHKLKKKQV